MTTITKTLKTSLGITHLPDSLPQSPLNSIEAKLKTVLEEKGEQALLFPGLTSPQPTQPFEMCAWESILLLFRFYHQSNEWRGEV